jgi:NADPH:quinone reductase-like Zn-dependent oxidoreductase
MKAVAVAHPGALEHDESLVDAILERPKPGPRDLLVAVQAISVNPVDTKVRRAGGASILGSRRGRSRPSGAT